MIIQYRYRNLFLIILFLLFFNNVQAQKALISGVVKGDDGLKVELANVILLKIPDTLEVAFTTTDSLGYYHFKDVGNGTYAIACMQLGFNKFISNSFTISNSDSIHYPIELVSEFQAAAEVVVAGRKSIVKHDGEKMIVNVENTVSNSGLSAIEVLRKSPGVSVNKDGVITLKGKNGVLVMLDDKPLYMTEEQVGNLLKSIPSDQIKEIEIITTPSAKYDAAGNAGIINIKLKKGAYEGFNGSVNASYGQGRYHKATVGVNVTYKKKKWSLNASYQYNNKVNMSKYHLYRTYTSDTSTYSKLNSDEYYKEPQEIHTTTLGGSYDMTKRTAINFNIIGGYAEYRWDGGSTTSLYKKNGDYNSSYVAKNFGAYRQTNFNNSLGIQHKIDTIGSVLSVDVNYNKFVGVSNKDFRIQNYDSTYQETGMPFVFIFRDPSYSNQYMMKADLVKKFSETAKLESGIKFNMIDQDNPASINITENGVTRDASNFYHYNEKIYAAYSSYYKTLGKFKLQGGLRVEHALSKGEQRIQDTSFALEYTNLFPSANINYNYSDKTSYSIIYSRRIQRPTPWQLNPVLNIVDPYTSWGGYPYLLPEYTDNAELNWSLFSGYLITTLNYSYTNQPIRWATIIDEKTLKTVLQPRNLVLQENMGVSTTLNIPITKWWQSTNYVFVYRARFVGDFGFGQTDNSVIALNANCTQAFTVNPKTSIEVSGYFQSASVYGLSQTLPQGQLTLAVQQKIWANKGLLKLSFSDVFWTDGWRANTTLGSIKTSSGERYDSRIVMVSFSYKFGKKLNNL